MIETKIFCDKCRKEIKYIPPGPDSSVITLEGEKHFEMDKDLGTFLPASRAYNFWWWTLS